jgi:hypothetical protein
VTQTPIFAVTFHSENWLNAIEALYQLSYDPDFLNFPSENGEN